MVGQELRRAQPRHPTLEIPASYLRRLRWLDLVAEPDKPVARQEQRVVGYWLTT
jgi:hypothetical protein